MHRKRKFLGLSISFLLLCSPIFAADQPALNPTSQTLTIYTYDSFVAKGGIGDFLIQKFKERTGADLKVIAPGDAAQVVAEIEREQKSKKGLRGELVVGIDLPLFERIRLLTRPLPFQMDKIRERYRKKEFTRLVPEDFLPFDYGYFAFIENKNLVKKSPKVWADFLHPTLKKKLLIEDPRTSTPGLAFFLFMHSLFSKDGSKLWKNLRENTLTLTPGWSAAYALFLKGEAPYVWSYTTSEAYHRAQKETHYRAVILEEGHPLQIEGAAILKDTPLVTSFLQLLISDEVQAKIPETQWMYPILKDVGLPPSFKEIKEPSKISVMPRNPIEIEEILKSWKTAVSEF
jgi:thiamine transport system substrate-binding protein